MGFHTVCLVNSQPPCSRPAGSPDGREGTEAQPRKHGEDSRHGARASPGVLTPAGGHVSHLTFPHSRYLSLRCQLVGTHPKWCLVPREGSVLAITIPSSAFDWTGEPFFLYHGSRCAFTVLGNHEEVTGSPFLLIPQRQPLLLCGADMDAYNTAEERPRPGGGVTGDIQVKGLQSVNRTCHAPVRRLVSN